MCACKVKPEIGPIDEARERVYRFLAALLSHPDEGKWGRVLNADEQRLAVATADSFRAAASDRKEAVLPGELSSDELDLRFLVVELCQPLEHLKAEHERIFCDPRIDPECSPYELDHVGRTDEFAQAESLADLAGVYRAFDFTDRNKLPLRPDHIAYELEFMAWLIGQRRLVVRLAPVDEVAAEQASRCDLAQRNFFGDHLANWVVSFANGLQNYTAGGYFEAVGRFLAAWIPFERHHLGLETESNESRCSRRAVPAGT
jgi:TorA maturation chaperone TorD